MVVAFGLVDLTKRYRGVLIQARSLLLLALLQRKFQLYCVGRRRMNIWRHVGYCESLQDKYTV
jgi:hypothetical protein